MSLVFNEQWTMDAVDVVDEMDKWTWTAGRSGHDLISDVHFVHRSIV